MATGVEGLHGQVSERKEDYRSHVTDESFEGGEHGRMIPPCSSFMYEWGWAEFSDPCHPSGKEPLSGEAGHRKTE